MRRSFGIYWARDVDTGWRLMLWDGKEWSALLPTNGGYGTDEVAPVGCLETAEARIDRPDAATRKWLNFAGPKEAIT